MTWIVMNLICENNGLREPLSSTRRTASKVFKVAPSERIGLTPVKRSKLRLITRLRGLILSTQANLTTMTKERMLSSTHMLTVDVKW